MAAFDELKDLLKNKRVKKPLAAKYMSADELTDIGKYLSANQLVGTESFKSKEIKDVSKSTDAALQKYRQDISSHVNKLAVIILRLTKESRQLYQKKLELLGAADAAPVRTLRRRNVQTTFDELVMDFNTANLEVTNIYLKLSQDISDANSKVERLKGLNVKSNESLEKMYNLAQVLQGVQKDQSEYEKLFQSSSEFEKQVKEMRKNIGTERIWNKYYVKALNELCKLFSDIVVGFGMYLDIQIADSKNDGRPKFFGSTGRVSLGLNIKDFARDMETLLDTFQVNTSEDIFSMKFSTGTIISPASFRSTKGLQYRHSDPIRNLKPGADSSDPILQYLEQLFLDMGTKIEEVLVNGIQDHP